MSAYVQVYGQFTFNNTPIAPPGVKVLVHEKPQFRGWKAHAVEGWYIGSTLDAYRCYRVWIWKTEKERTTDTLAWFPHYVTMPTATSTDLLLAVLRDVVHALNNPSSNSPLAPLTDSHVQHLKALVSLWSHKADNPTTSTVPPLATPAESPALRVTALPPVSVPPITPLILISPIVSSAVPPLSV